MPGVSHGGREPSRARAGAFFLLILAAGVCGAMDLPRFSYSVSLGGYSADAFPQAEALEISARAESDSRRAFSPYLGLRFLLPTDAPGAEGTFLGIGAGCTLFYAKEHPFRWMSARDTAWAPSAGITAFVPLSNPLSPRYRLEMSPLRLFNGQGYYSILPLYLALDGEARISGWGFGLFEFSYAMP